MLLDFLADQLDKVPFKTIVPIAISGIALLVAFRNYNRKSGVLVRGSYSIASSRDGNDAFVSHVTLENQKDRAISVFGIYLQVGYGCYVELEKFSSAPLVLKAFEPYHREFGPIEFYAASSRRINLNALLHDSKVRKRLVLSTGDGKYVVPSNIRHWDPMYEFFRNHRSGLVRPIPSKYKGQYLGSNIKYVIEFLDAGGKEQIVSIHPQDYELRKFNGFQLTKASLESKEALESFLEAKRTEGTISYDKVTVHDVDAWRVKAHEFYKGKQIQLRNYNAFQFHVGGRLGTMYADWKLRQNNKLLAAEHRHRLPNSELRGLSHYHLFLEQEKATNAGDLNRIAIVQAEIDRRENS